MIFEALLSISGMALAVATAVSGRALSRWDILHDHLNMATLLCLAAIAFECCQYSGSTLIPGNHRFLQLASSS